MTLDAQRMGPSRRMALALWRLLSHHHYPPPRRWMATVTLFPSLVHTRRWATTTVALMSKEHHLGLVILQLTIRLLLRNITDKRTGIGGGQFNQSRYPLLYRRLPSTEGRPLRISTHQESTKTGKLRFPRLSMGLRSHQDINLESAERKRKKTLWNSQLLRETAGRKRSQKCSGGSVDPMVCRSFLPLSIPRHPNSWFTTLRENCRTPSTSTSTCGVWNRVRRVTRGRPNCQPARHSFQVYPISGGEEGGSRGGDLQAQRQLSGHQEPKRSLQLGYVRPSLSCYWGIQADTNQSTEGDVDLLASDEYWDPHAIAGLLKTFMRELPASILTRELHTRFLSVIGGCEFSVKGAQLIDHPRPCGCSGKNKRAVLPNIPTPSG